MSSAVPGRERVIKICRIKLSIDECVIDRDYELKLRWKIGRPRGYTKTDKALFPAMTRLSGVKKDMWPERIQYGL